MSSKKWPPKDKDEILDYTIDWTARLEGDILSASSYVIPVGLTEQFDTFDDTTTTVWLSGGTDGEVYEILNRVITAGGRTYDQTVKLKVKER